MLLIILEYSFKNELLKRNYNLNLKKTILQENEYEKEKEYLLTKLSKSIHKEIINLKYEDVYNMLSSLQYNTIKYNDSYAAFDEKDKNIILVLKKQNNPTKKEIYKVTIEEGNLKYQLINELYINKE